MPQRMPADIRRHHQKPRFEVFLGLVGCITQGICLKNILGNFLGKVHTYETLTPKGLVPCTAQAHASPVSLFWQGRIFDSVGIYYRNGSFRILQKIIAIFEVIFKIPQNVPKNTSDNISGHDSAHRGVRVDIPLPYLLFGRDPKHVPGGSPFFRNWLY